MIRLCRIIFFTCVTVCPAALHAASKEDASVCSEGSDDTLSLLQVRASEHVSVRAANAAGAGTEQEISVALDRFPTPGLHWEPDVLIVGLENSSSNVVSRLMNHLGLLTSSVRYEPHIHEIAWAPTKYVNELLDHAGGQISQEGYMRNFLAWKKVLDIIKISSSSTALSIMSANVEELPSRENTVWGLQEPSLLYLLPAYDYVYNKQAKYLMVTADPRTVCSSVTNLADSFKMFGPHLQGSKRSSEDCFGWWAGVMNNILDLYESEARFKIVRFEDLAVPGLTTDAASLAVLGCMAKFAGLPEPKTELANELVNRSRNPAILSEQFQRPLSQEIYSVHTPLEKKELSDLEVSLRRRADADAIVEKALVRLGYRASTYGITQAASPAVCSLR